MSMLVKPTHVQYLDEPGGVLFVDHNGIVRSRQRRKMPKIAVQIEPDGEMWIGSCSPGRRYTTDYSRFLKKRAKPGAKIG